MAFSLIKDIDNFFTKFFAKTDSAQKVWPPSARWLAHRSRPDGRRPGGRPGSHRRLHGGTDRPRHLPVHRGAVGHSPTALNVLNAINSNLTGLLQDAQVKNSAKSAEITAKVNAVVSEVNAIAAFFPARPGLSVLPEARTLARGRGGPPRGSPAAFPSPRQARGLTFWFESIRGPNRGRRFCRKRPGKCLFPTWSCNFINKTALVMVQATL